jgi:hypothetical protein
MKADTSHYECCHKVHYRSQKQSCGVNLEVTSAKTTAHSSYTTTPNLMPAKVHEIKKIYFSHDCHQTTEFLENCISVSFCFLRHQTSASLDPAEKTKTSLILILLSSNPVPILRHLQSHHTMCPYTRQCDEIYFTNVGGKLPCETTPR